MSDRKQVTVLEFNRPSRSELHPTTKPVELFEYQMLNSTQPLDVVLDIFGGSGSTLLAAEKNNRKACVMEIGENYCDVIINRWQNFTGQKAKLESTGQLYDEIASIS
jgi:site-specific DNA-methyltransferase (adenine-specific)